MTHPSTPAVLADLYVALDREIGREDHYGPMDPADRQRWRRELLAKLEHHLNSMYPDQVENLLNNAYDRIL